MLKSPDSPFRVIPADKLAGLLEDDPDTRQKKLDHIKNYLAADENRISIDLVAGAMLAIEVLLFVAISLVAYAIYFGIFDEKFILVYIPVIAGAAALYSISLNVAGLYTLQSLLRPIKAVPTLSAALFGVFSLIFALVFFFKLGDSYSRVWLGSWMFASLTAAAVLRFSAGKLLRNWTLKGRLNRRAVIVGGGDMAAELIRSLEESVDSDVSIVGIFDDRNDERSPWIVSGYPKLGTIDELEEFARKVPIDLLLLTLPVQAENRLLELAQKLWILPVDIRLSANTQKLRYRPRAYSYIGSVPFLAIFDRPLNDWDKALKMVSDKLIASVALLLASPLMLLIAAAIKLESRGPVLFVQKRYGFNNELIEVYKFRSMHADKCDADAKTLVTKNDPRVTGVGRFIRKSSLDELPQLFNVLKGDLSLVGPRPHATQAKANDSLYQEAVESYYARHRVKPGITGWAQINGWRGETDTVEKIERRVEHDFYYIENWSLMLDMYILWRTPIALLKTEQAY